MTPVLHDLLGGTALLLLFLAVISGAETAMRLGRIAPETARKSIHLAGGLGCLLFPFLISSWVTVLVLASGFSAILYFGETRRLLQALCAVNRTSLGSLLFPISILILFVFSKNRLWQYLAALLVLVLADTSAALVGTRFGRIFYQTAPNERKSLEGTLAFGLVGFLAVFLPLWLLSDIPPLTCVLTAALMALLLAGLEAVSVGGTDNLLVPLATIFLLWKLPDKPPIEILFQCLSLAAITLLVFQFNRRYETLQMRPLLVFILVTYAAWSLGSADWMIPVLSGFVIYNRICAPCAPRPPDPAALKVLRPLYPSITILFCANATLKLAFWQGPFLAATAVAATLCTAERFRTDPTRQALGGGRLAAAILLPGTVSCLLCLPIQGCVILTALPLLILLCAVATLIHRAIFLRHPDSAPWRYWMCVCAGAAALTHAALQEAGIIPPLDPSTWREIFRCP